MGFLIVKVMKEFSMSLGEVLGMPIRHFMWLESQVDRLRADLDIRLYRVLCAVNSAEAAEKVLDALNGEVGEVATFGPLIVPDVAEDDTTIDPEFDREKLRSLKARMGG